MQGQLERRDRTLVKGDGLNMEGLTQFVARFRPGTAADYLDELRTKIAACRPPTGTSIRIVAQRFAGQDALRVEVNYGESYTGTLIVLRQGDLVSQFTVSDGNKDQATALARRAAARMCGGTAVC